MSYGYVDITPASAPATAWPAVTGVVARGYPNRALATLIGARVKDGDGAVYEVLGPQKIRWYKPEENAQPATRGPTSSQGQQAPAEEKKKVKFDAELATQILQFVTSNTPAVIGAVKDVIASTESLASLKKKLAQQQQLLAGTKDPVKRAGIQAVIDTIKAKIQIYEQQGAGLNEIIGGSGSSTGLEEESAFPTWLPFAGLGLGIGVLALWYFTQNKQAQVFT